MTRTARGVATGFGTGARLCSATAAGAGAARADPGRDGPLLRRCHRRGACAYGVWALLVDWTPSMAAAGTIPTDATASQSQRLNDIGCIYSFAIRYSLHRLNC